MENIRKFITLKLKWKLVLIFLTFVILPMAILGSVTYLKMTEVYNQRAVQSAKELISKIELNITNLIEDTEDISTYMIYDEDFQSFLEFSNNNPEYIEQQADIQERLRGVVVFHLMSKDYINSVNIKGYKGNLLHIGEPIESSIDKKLSEKVKQAQGSVIWSDVYQAKSAWTGKKEILTLARQINDIDSFHEPLGQIRINLDVEKLNNIIYADSINKFGDLLLVNEDGEIILNNESKNLKINSGKLVDRIMTNSNKNSFIYEHNKDEYVVYKKQLQGANWHLISILNRKYIAKDLDQIKTIIGYMVVVTVLLGLVGLFGFYLSNTKRILELTRETRRVENGDFFAQVRESSNDEIGQLGKRFNIMVKKIQTLIHQEYRLKIQQQESELKALQNQIDPHFLYNTLDMIRWTARLEKAPETSQLIELLSSLFRSSLSSGRVWVGLSEELTFTENYLELQQKRLGGLLEYKIEVSDNICDAIILKQILQPIVENSIQHGFKQENGEGKIFINCFKEDETLVIEVIDNGSGLSRNEFKRVLEGQNGFALYNIQNRLVTSYGRDYGIKLIETGEKGTCLRLEIPFQL